MIKITNLTIAIILTILCSSCDVGNNDQPQSSEAKLKTFVLLAKDGEFEARITDNRVVVSVPYGTDLNVLLAEPLAASFTSSKGSSVSANGQIQESGATTNIYNDTMRFTVTSEDGAYSTYYTVDVLMHVNREQLINMIKAGDDVTRVDTYDIINMNSIFEGSDDFNQDISNWDVSNVTHMNNMFHGARKFNQDISNWDVSNVISMIGMFQASVYNKDLSSWNVHNVRYMTAMFSLSRFNQDLSNWDVRNVTDMLCMFNKSHFNQNISSWHVGNVTNMGGMFGNSFFNQDLSSWNVSNVTDMSFMFKKSIYNQDISDWDVSNVTDMSSMFEGSSFNQDLSSWKSKVNVNIPHDNFSYNAVFFMTEDHPYESWDD